MCSQRTMENYQGDLTDILRASGTQTAAEAAATAALQDWQFPSNHPFIYPADPGDDFGDPFSHHLRDPLLHGTIDNAPTGFFHSSDISIKSIGADEMKRPNNMFSRMLQIAPNAKLPLPPSPSLCDSPAAVLTNDHALISPSSAKGCLMESSAAAAALQISSPRNTGIRRRKSQAKKVVCIPAPAPANSRSSGEIVPSDLWAWRKYGQKPIKGSPYPRGYYRCSSSKGCSARKQVERSRTDPNMLVITYTSEHNHPWPTQRNALAGSTRSQPSKNATTPAKSSTSSSSNSHKCKEEQKEIATEEEENALARPPPPSSSSSTVIKEENMEQDHFDNAEFDDQGFPHSYKPTLPPDNISHSEDSFFADLGEIDGDDPLDILLTQGFSGDDGRDGGKGLDPFSFYDWAAGNTATTRDSPPPPPPPTTTAAAASKNDSS